MTTLINLNYMTTKTAAEQWSISQRRVLALCAEERIEGLAKVDNIWLIPKDATKPPDARRVRSETDTLAGVRPFLKWAGGKGQLLSQIQMYYPFDNKNITKYAEPFVGGGAVLFDILSRHKLDAVYISDANAELVNAYRVIRSSIDDLIALLSTYQSEYIPMGDEERKKYYMAKRTRFNKLKSEHSRADIEMSALMIFLNRTCFNGLYRVNRKGEFNVPIGAYKLPLICDEKNLRSVSKSLQDVEIVCGDYRQSADFIDSHTFVYFDPPYRPLTETASFTSYAEGGFDDQSQVELAEFVQQLDKIGARILLSNSDPKNTDENDDFFDRLYKEQTIHRVSASRSINSKASHRGKISELLITNF